MNKEEAISTIKNFIGTIHMMTESITMTPIMLSNVVEALYVLISLKKDR